MKKAKTPRKLLPFDAARYLTNEAAIAEQQFSFWNLLFFNVLRKG